MADTRRQVQHERALLLHMHSKHAATLDGHRPDDPNAVTGPWPQFGPPSKAWQEWSREEVTARPVGWDGGTRRQPAMWQGRDAQGVIVAAASGGRTGTIQREPDTVPFDDENNYGQRVEAFDDLAERVDLEEQGWEPGEGPLEHEADPYAKVAMEGQPTAPKGGTYVDALYVKGSREDRLRRQEDLLRRRLAEAKPSDLETQASPWQTNNTEETK